MTSRPHPTQPVLPHRERRGHPGRGGSAAQGTPVAREFPLHDPEPDTPLHSPLRPPAADLQGLVGLLCGNCDCAQDSGRYPFAHTLIRIYLVTPISSSRAADITHVREGGFS